jgi:hypothetical protein
MPGLVPGIFFGGHEKDRRDEPGNDEVVGDIVHSRHPGEGRDPAFRAFDARSGTPGLRRGDAAFVVGVMKTKSPDLSARR